MTTTSNRPTVPPSTVPRVLVVEDEYLIVQDLLRVLQQLGVDVVGPFADPQSAVQALEHEPVTAALVDVRLRGGTTAVSLVHALQERDVPVLLVTGYDETALGDSLRNLPRLGKPFNVDQAVQRIRRLLET